MIIKFETAKLAKEKGFDLKVWYNYNYLGKLNEDLGVGYGIDEGIEDATDLKCNFNYVDPEYLKYEQSNYDRVAKLTLKELQICYDNPDIDEIEKNRIQTNALYSLENYKHQCSAPTQSELQTWLRNVHEIIVCAIPNFYNKRKLLGYIYTLDKFENGIHDGNDYDKEMLHALGDKSVELDTYEEALEFGLQEALKLI